MPAETKNKPKILISSLMMAEEPERFRDELREFDVDFYTTGQFLTEQEISNYLASNGPIHGWISGDDEITDSILEQASPSLKIISKWGSGLDSIDLESAKQRGIAVSNSPGKISDAVAEVALSYAIDLLRGLSFQDRQVRAGHWVKPEGRNLTGATVGIIGFGRVGQRLHKLLMYLGCKVLVSDPAYPHNSTELNDLLTSVSVLILCAPLNQKTQGLINERTLSLMRKDAVIVNVARGPLVVEKDLLEALEKGRIGGAALDVFEVEPLSPESGFHSLENTILGCHNANNSREAKEAVHLQATKNLKHRLTV